MEEEKEAQVRGGEKYPVRIYISHEVSKKDKEGLTPLFIAKKKVNVSKTSEGYISVFGVQVPNKNVRSNT